MAKSTMSGEAPSPAPTVLSERLTSAAQQQSQESYLVPRNCWIRMRSLNIKYQPFEKNQKLRLRIYVPNSGRILKTSYIPLDEATMSYLGQAFNSSDIAEIPVDITVLCEYRHDIRHNHSSMLELELELTSSILARTRILGSASFDMSEALQRPFIGVTPLKKDLTVFATIEIELHSLCISQTSPSVHPNSATLLLSDSDSDIASLMTNNVPSVLTSPNIVMVDATKPEGQVLLQSLKQTGYAIGITDVAQINHFFETASQVLTETSPKKVIIAGGNSFFCRVLSSFLVIRDKGALRQESFAFILIPISSENKFLTLSFGSLVPSYASKFLDPSWFNLFTDEASVYLLAAKFDEIFQSKLVTAPLHIIDVLITTSDNQFVVPMLMNLQIGDESRFIPGNIRTTSHLIQLKATFISNRAKYSNIRLHHLSCSFSDGIIHTHWREVTNSNILPMMPSLDRFGIEEHRKQSSKVSFSLVKGQKPLEVQIDGNVITDVKGLTLTIRDPEAALLVNVPE